jgi:hypothetical protein
MGYSRKRIELSKGFLEGRYEKSYTHSLYTCVIDISMGINWDSSGSLWGGVSSLCLSAQENK